MAKIERKKNYIYISLSHRELATGKWLNKMDGQDFAM